ncbi:MAG: hypothetical protein KAV99_07340, partial [Candidatus Latescibacteria bacterium]|nr:hypothetical protein [Candidatus Latescibacterota bacterium]
AHNLVQDADLRFLWFGPVNAERPSQQRIGERTDSEVDELSWLGSFGYLRKFEVQQENGPGNLKVR